MGISSSKNGSSSESKIFGSHILAPIARLLTGRDHGDRGLIHHRQDVDLREELDALKRTMEDQIGSLTQERDGAREEVKEKSEALVAAQREQVNLSNRMETLNANSRSLAEQTRTLNDQIGQAQGQAYELKEQLARREIEMRMVGNELTQIKAQHTQTVALLVTRTSELKGAQAFLTKADTVSGADVVRMVEGLNAEILQAAAFMADHFVFEDRGEVTEEVQAACGRLEELLGHRIVQLLGSIDHADDPMLIQLACQASTTMYCRWMILSWDFDDPNYDQFLKHVYLTVRTVEDQAVSGRWRALTRTHVQSMLHGSSDASSLLVPHIADTLVDVLLVAGLKASYEHIHEVVMTTFEDKLTTIVRLALGLNWVVGREVTSGDLEPTTVLWDAAFDPSEMVDVNREGDREDGKMDRVLCTTDLGLQLIVKVGKDVEGKEAYHTTTLLQPKVALESVIEGLVEPEENNRRDDTPFHDSPNSMASHEKLPPNGHA